MNVFLFMFCFYIVGGILSLFMMFNYFIPILRTIKSDNYNFYGDLTNNFKGNYILNIVDKTNDNKMLLIVITKTFFTSWVSAIAITLFIKEIRSLL